MIYTLDASGDSVESEAFMDVIGLYGIRVYPPCHNRRGKGYTFAVNKGFMHGEGYSEALGS